MELVKDGKQVRLLCTYAGANLHSFLITLTQGKFPTEYVPTVFDNYEAITTYEGETFKYLLWETAPQQEYIRIRTLSYPKTDLFILAYAIDNHESFVNIDKWNKEITDNMQAIYGKVVLGLRTDLRNENTITYEDGARKAEEIGAIGYIECSSREGGAGLQEVEDTLLHYAALKAQAIRLNDFTLINNYRISRKLTKTKNARKIVAASIVQ
jgi:small GTP-binding protein